MQGLDIPGLISWPLPNDPIHSRCQISRGSWHWIADADIQRCLDTGHFENVNRPRIPRKSHDAARVASLVRILRSGNALDPILVALTRRNLDGIDPRLFKLEFIDGNHRFRAYQFLNRLTAIPCKFRDTPGVASLFEPFFTAAPTPALHP
jgi:hypothetical protein